MIVTAGAAMVRPRKAELHTYVMSFGFPGGAIEGDGVVFIG